MKKEEAEAGCVIRGKLIVDERRVSSNVDPEKSPLSLQYKEKVCSPMGP